uniref:Uncharacterized protein n=1 Tax=Populus trichocarpa TaxID=3694 RepID=A0A2K2AUR4_POPTR
MMGTVTYNDQMKKIPVYLSTTWIANIYRNLAYQHYHIHFHKLYKEATELVTRGSFFINLFHGQSRRVPSRKPPFSSKHSSKWRIWHSSFLFLFKILR